MSRFAKRQRAQRLQAETRRKEVVKMTLEKVSRKEQATQLGVSEKTVQRDQHLVRQRLISENQAEVSDWRKSQLEELENLRAEVEKHRRDGRALSLAQLDRLHDFLKTEIRLTGTEAPSRAVVGHISTTVEPERMRLFDRFMFETRELGFEDYDKLWAYCKELTRLRPKVVVGPPADSPLWKDEEDDTPLLEGGPE